MRAVLIVEDSSATRAFVRAALEDPQFSRRWGGVSVSEASSGFEAMRMLPRKTFDLIVTDINMADINGLELIQFIRRSEHHKATPLVIVSTQNTQKDIERGLALGANSYVAKPFTAEALRACCSEWLGPDDRLENRD